MTGTSFVLESVPLRGENEFEPHLQNEILVYPVNFIWKSPPGVARTDVKSFTD